MKKIICEKMRAARWHTDGLYDKMKEIIDELRNHGNFDSAKLDEAYVERQIILKLLIDAENALNAMP